MLFFSFCFVLMKQCRQDGSYHVVKSVSSGARLPELVSQLCHFKVCDIEHTV